MTHPLEGCREKLRRAHEHIRDLNAEIKSFIQAGGYTLTSESNEHGPVFTASGDPVSVRLRVLIGEVVYQLRSALDHLVWQLVIANNQEPGTANEFPILLSAPPPPGYPKKKSAFERKVEGVSPIAVAVIEALQPYHWPMPKDEPLAVLHELNIIDKHRLLIATIADVSMNRNGIDAVLAAQDSADTGSRLFEPEMEVKKHVTVQILLKDAGGREPKSVVPFLSQLASHVEEIIRLLEPELV